MARKRNSDQPIKIYPSVEDFLSMERVQPGRLCIMDSGRPIDILFDPVENSQTALVCFHGAIAADTSLPFFLGRGVTEGLGTTRIFVSDSTLLLGEGFSLSWYIGSASQPRLVESLTLILAKLFSVSGSAHKVFFGSSGGGFAALLYSRLFPGSLALPMNPQSNLLEHRDSATGPYSRAAWGVESLEQIEEKIPLNLVGLYDQFFPNTIGYIQNLWDWIHIQKHQLPFLEAHGDHPRLLMLMGRWGDGLVDSGHIPAPKGLVRSFLAAAASADGQWVDGLRSVGFSSETLPKDVSASLKRHPANLR